MSFFLQVFKVKLKLEFGVLNLWAFDLHILGAVVELAYKLFHLKLRVFGGVLNAVKKQVATFLTAVPLSRAGKVFWVGDDGGGVTLPETNVAPATLGLEDEFSFGMAYFQGRTVRVHGGYWISHAFLLVFVVCMHLVFW